MTKLSKALLLPMAIGALAVAQGCGGGSTTVALLLSGANNEQHEEETRYDFEKAIGEACSNCRIEYRNAAGNYAEQKRQSEKILEAGPDVVVLDPVRTDLPAMVKKAHALDIPVLNYQSLILEAGVDAFVHYDPVKVGEVQARALSEGLEDGSEASGPVVMLNGEPGNPEQPETERSARAEFAEAGVDVARRDYTPFWLPREAHVEMQLAIRKLGPDGFEGVYAETDGIAGGAIAAMQSAGLDPHRIPTTGQDSTVHGLRRILSGTQYMTTYEPVESMASAGAEIALALAAGDELPKDKINGTVNDLDGRIPAALLTPATVTRENIAQTVIADGVVPLAKLCAGSFEARCRAVDLR